ncbi:radical SAM protein [Cloacibacillus porcorum]|uniref:radical SAM protein n=1 Tax=Cloacibacillus porcorum TaxID=1197717 RepID=UPI0023F0F34E|nr:radical SAM protein [Cloacibacillus porcorum]MDD7648558.1 radical SAM protein [Cloacibacillus porcorum]MDY4092948.1 radical SAM protein [Cloacibacillus porcorum]
MADKLKKLPFFLPFAGCRGQCVYCNQRAITGVTEVPSPDYVRAVLKDIKEPREICYFGGSFCRFPEETIKAYLDCVAEYAPAGSAVRFSTYPGDLRDDALRALIKKYPVSRIELGIPTLDPAVLAACRREAAPEKIFEDISLLMKDSLPVGVQMMIGLPGQRRESSLRDLTRLAELKGGERWELRLYPCLVIAGTELERLYRRGEYRPLSVEEAALWGGEFIELAVVFGFVPIRIGLQEMVSLAAEVKAGPHHPALGELILAEAEARRLVKLVPKGPWQVPRRDISKFRGHGGFGIKRLAIHAGISENEAAKQIVYES